MNPKKELTLTLVAAGLIVIVVIQWAVMLGRMEPRVPGHIEQAPEWEAVRIRRNFPEADFLYVKTHCPACQEANNNVARMRDSHPDQKFLIVDPRSVNVSALMEMLGRTYGVDDPVERAVTPVLYGPSQIWIGVDDVKNARLTPEDLQGKRPFTRLGSSWDWIKTGNAAMIDRLENYQWHFVALAGLIDGINPCAISTIIFLLSYLTLTGMRKNTLAIGLLFAAGCFVTYLMLGVGLWQVSAMAGGALWGRRILYPLIAFIALFLAITAFSEFGKIIRGIDFKTRLKLPENWLLGIHQVIRNWVRAEHVLLLAVPIAVVVTLIEFGCTGQIYLPTITYVASLPGHHFQVIPVLLVYNIAFIVPLLAVLFVHHFAARSFSREDTPVPMRWVRLGEGLILVVVAAFMLWSTYHAWL